jgi:hypothetical protein
VKTDRETLACKTVRAMATPIPEVELVTSPFGKVGFMGGYAQEIAAQLIRFLCNEGSWRQLTE